MVERIVVPFDQTGIDEAVLARAETAARVSACPIHLICFVDVNKLAHFGAHGPVIERSTYCEQMPQAHETAQQCIASVAQQLTDRGNCVTYELRTGLLKFELPAALRPGDIVVTDSERYAHAAPRRSTVHLLPQRQSGGAGRVSFGR